MDVDGKPIENEDLTTTLSEGTETPHTGHSGSWRTKLLWTLLLIQVPILILFIIAFFNDSVFEYLNDLFEDIVDGF